MQPKEASVFPLEGPPPIKTGGRFNATQFKQKMNLIDTNTKFNLSFLKMQRQQTLGHGHAALQKTSLSVIKTPQTDMKIQINHRQSPMREPDDVATADRAERKMSIADRIKEVKAIHKYAGTPKLTTQQTLSPVGSPTSTNTKSYGLTRKRGSNPFTSPRTSILSDVAKRFKNQSAREAPVSHISDQVYANMQNQSLYNNAYQYIKRKNGSPRDETRVQVSKSLSQRGAKEPQNAYRQRKLSHLERPTQLEIGGEGSPMLSLLPPLKTREISPKYNYTIGRQVQEQRLTLA